MNTKMFTPWSYTALESNIEPELMHWISRASKYGFWNLILIRSAGSIRRDKDFLGETAVTWHGSHVRLPSKWSISNARGVKDEKCSSQRSFIYMYIYRRPYYWAENGDSFFPFFPLFLKFWWVENGDSTDNVSHKWCYFLNFYRL